MLKEFPCYSCQMDGTTKVFREMVTIVKNETNFMLQILRNEFGH